MTVEDAIAEVSMMLGRDVELVDWARVGKEGIDVLMVVTRDSVTYRGYVFTAHRVATFDGQRLMTSNILNQHTRKKAQT